MMLKNSFNILRSDISNRITFYTWIFFSLIFGICGLPELLRIGGLFGAEDDPTTEAALRYAIYRINQDRALLKNTKIAYDIQHLPDANSFLAAKKACNQAGLGVAAIFGPKNHEIASHINSMCNTLEVPHIEARLEPYPNEFQAFSINLYPDTDMLSRAYVQLLKHFQWKKFCVIYGDEIDLLLLQDVIRAELSTMVEITVRQASRENMREVLKQIDKKGITHVIAHLSTDDTYWLLKAALQLGMIDPAHHFIIANLDIDVINLDDFRHNYVNLTGFRLVNYTNPKTRDILNQMATYEHHAGIKLLNKTSIIKSEAALMYDAVYALAHALQQLDESSQLRLVNLTCDGDQGWAFGSTLYNYLNMVSFSGLTGTVTFDRGRRVDFTLDILQLQSSGLKKVGNWNVHKGISITSEFEIRSDVGMFGNKTLIVTSILYLWTIAFHIVVLLCFQ